MTRVGRYLERWRADRPLAPLSADYFDREVSPEIRNHRRIAAGAPGLPRRAALLPLQGWLALRWFSGGAAREIASVPQLRMERYAEATGIGPDAQRRALRALARKHGITPDEAYDFDLIRHPQSWAEFVYDREFGWNLAVSGSGGARAVALVSDKFRASQFFGTLGIDTPQTILIERGITADPARSATDWLSRWPAVVGKPRFGSGGDGLFELLPDDTEGFVLRHYQRPGNAENASTMLGQLLGSSDYVVQPRQVSHPLFAGLADLRRVVVLRLVTRDAGNGPALFSGCVEIAQPLIKGTPWVAYVGVGPTGVMGEVAGPAWWQMARKAVSSYDAHDGGELSGVGAPVEAPLVPGPLAEQERIVAALRGRTVPHLASGTEMALRAHRALPGLFAAAWDIALTPSGAVMLEGNTGFGTVTPQWISGGLFAEVA